MSKMHYLKCKDLHSLPKSVSTTEKIQVGNEQYANILLIIPIIIDMYGHRFEIYILLLEIHENVYSVLDIKNTFELGGVMNSRESCFSISKMCIPFFQRNRLY